MQINLDKISGEKKNAWGYSPRDGKLSYIGEFDSGVTTFQHDSGYNSGNDHILIAVDASRNYIEKEWSELPDAQKNYPLSK